MCQEVAPKQMIAELESFLKSFKQYGKEVCSNKPTTELEALASPLRRAEPKITDIILKILGNWRYEVQERHITCRELLGNALTGGDNAMPRIFRDFDAIVTTVIERAIGTLEAGLWPLKMPVPILVIQDTELRQGCADLLRASGNYDRVVREATTVLEDRMRRKPGHDVLSRLIPNSGDQTGENLVNKLFDPDRPVLSISSDKTKRIAFRKILVGVVSYVRNDYHHRLDPETEWSWAWSVVGFIDQLLTDIENCSLMGSDGNHK